VAPHIRAITSFALFIVLSLGFGSIFA